MDSKSLTRQVVSSGFGAITTSFFMTPLDVIKVRLQIQPKKGQKFFYCNGLMDCLCIAENGRIKNESVTNYYKRCWYRRPLEGLKCNTKYKSGIDAGFKIVKFEGITSLWSGLGPTIGLSAFSVCLYFTLYEGLREEFKKSAKTEFQKNYLAVPLAGTTARVTTIFFITPGEVIRTRLQADSKTNLTKVLKQIKLEKNWYKGFTPTLMRDVPFSAIYWTVNEKIRTDYLKSEFFQKSNFWKSFVSGALAGALSAGLTHPFDVMKTRQQTVGKYDLSQNLGFREILKKEGVNGIFAGVRPRIFRTSMACAIMLGSYEFTKSFF